MSRKKILKFDELVDFTPLTIGDRINYIAASNKLNSSEFSKLMGISTGNLNSLINDDSKPSATFLARMLEKLDVNANWVLAGNGEMYASKGCKPADPLNEDPEIWELLQGARKVLTSGNRFAFDALARNIQYFSLAIETEKDFGEMKRNQAQMENRVVELENLIQKLSKALEEKKPRPPCGSLDDEAI